MHISMDALHVVFRMDRNTQTGFYKSGKRDLCFMHAVAWALKGEDVQAVTTENSYSSCDECDGCTDWDGEYGGKDV